MDNLFPGEPIAFSLPDADVTYYPKFYDTTQSDAMFNELFESIPWQQDDIRIFGKTHAQPRLTALFGNDGKPYSYSNIIMQPQPWSSILLKIKSQVENIAQIHFTTVLLNLYRNGKDSNGWHADNEKELGKNPVIASVSFGASRIFHLKHNLQPQLKQSIILESGSLLLMRGSTQHFWKHQIPKTAKPIGSRINLTFRVIQ